MHVNAYLTPPGAQGLKYHYDPYVTLIVQLAGRKAWPLHPPFVENPTTEYGNFLEYLIGALLLLESGTVAELARKAAAGAGR
ncbi:hypothetical protein ASE09_06015 [Streptomyces sp. Root66D1]|nr:hypothetical protein ASD33_06010 [Streptomyces sp. Root1304]KRA89724.1 hypothetical protein ASE09_06015 [Streptomyces sp. Root66D1]